MAGRSRIEWIDCAKGITILLVIIAHTVPELYGVIYSFHMPLFFALSCVTYQFSKDTGELLMKTKSAFRHLIVPSISVYFVVTVCFVFNNHNMFLSYDDVMFFFIGKILTLIYASAVEVTINDIRIDAIGPIWFLTALFIGRTLFDYLQLRLSKKKLIMFCVVLSLLGILLGKTLWLPFSLDVVFALMPIFYFGYVLNQFHVEIHPCLKFFVYSMLWIIVFLPFHFSVYDYLDFGVRSYPFYPFFYLTTIFGTLMVAEFSVLLVKQKKVIYPLLYLGKNSLYMLLIHYVDGWYWKLWIVKDNVYYTTFYRIVLNTMIFCAVMFIVEKIRRYRGTNLHL